MVTKEKNYSYNLVLKIKESGRYELETFSTSSSGKTEGEWKQLSSRKFILFPDGPILNKIKIGDTLVWGEKYRPFADTLYFLARRNKIIRFKESGTPLTLYKVTNFKN